MMAQWIIYRRGKKGGREETVIADLDAATHFTIGKLDNQSYIDIHYPGDMVHVVEAEDASAYNLVSDHVKHLIHQAAI